MNKIYVEVPITTNQTTLSIPCGDDESLWHFTVIFNENEYLHKRLVTVMDNFDDGENPAVQSMLVTNENNRTATFEYHMDKDVKVDVIMHTTHIFMEITGLIKLSRIIKEHGCRIFIETHITGSIGYLFMTIWKMEN